MQTIILLLKKHYTDNVSRFTFIFNDIQTPSETVLKYGFNEYKNTSNDPVCNVVTMARLSYKKVMWQIGNIAML